MHGAVYVGTSLDNANKASYIMELLIKEDIRITYDWTKHGRAYDEESLIKIGIAEEQGIKDCQVFLMIFPGRSGTHVELGLARGMGKHIVMLEEKEKTERKTFYYLPGIKKFKSETETIKHIKQFLTNME